ncbi:MAG TPA: glycosyltransferase family 2 protein [Actinomycetota bacterium]|nr:glycosyltransferase family 2 protein [Actinomycetota bacterium]
MSTPKLDAGLIERLITSLDLELVVEGRAGAGEAPAGIRALFAGSAQLDISDGLPAGVSGRRALLWLGFEEPASLIGGLQKLDPLNPRSVVVVERLTGLLESATGMMDLLGALRPLSSAHRLLILGDSALFYPDLAGAAVRDYTGRRGIDWTDSRYGNEEVEAAEAKVREKDKVIVELSRELELTRRDRADKEEFINRLSNELPLSQTLIFVDAKLRRYLGAFLWPVRLVVRVLLKVLRAVFAIRLNHNAQYPPRPLPGPEEYRPVSLPEKPPLISIVTPSFNQAEYVADTVNSVLGQQYPRLEYIVQDGGSQDETVKVLEELSGSLAYWESAPDGGQANAVNLGMRRATGDILAWLNSDDLLLPGSLAYVAGYFEQHPEVDVVYGNRVLIDSEGRDIGRWVMPPHDDETLRWADYVPQETLFWRRSAWEGIGGCLDEDFHFALDWDMLLRFRESGATIVRLPRFLGAFRIHDFQKNFTIGHVHGSEVRKLIARTHGREMSAREIHANMKPFFRRHVVCDRLFRLGVLRYGMKSRFRKRPIGGGPDGGR